MQLKDKVVAVTGGARGIGKAIASAFVERGARVAIIDLNPSDLEATRAEFAESGTRVGTYAANVAREDQVIAAFNGIVADFGRLDVLVNNAGIIKDGLLVKAKDGVVTGRMGLEQWQAVIDVNLTGVFLCGREAAERMIGLGHGGLIINISSISKCGNAGQTNYSAAKAGVTAMAVVWAKELARYGIRAASIAPGFTARTSLRACRRKCSRKSRRPCRSSDSASRRKSPTPPCSSRRTTSLPGARSTSTAACASDFPLAARRPAMLMQDIRAIVTGGASGLGLAVVEHVIAAGGRATLLDVNEAAGLEAVQRLGERSAFRKVDVTSESAVDAAVQSAVTSMGGLNLAVNCAGVGWPKRLVGKEGPMPGDLLRKAREINLVGTLLVCKAAAAAMQKGAPNADGERGAIVMTASVAAFDGQIGRCRLRGLQGRHRRHDVADGP